MDELSAVGITSFGGPDDNGKVASFTHEMQQDTAVGAVVCGVDPGLSYYKVSMWVEGWGLLRWAWGMSGNNGVWDGPWTLLLQVSLSLSVKSP
jgi:hypothetical protein